MKTRTIAVAAALFGVAPSMLSAATITIVSPEEGAIFDTHSPCVNEFYENFEKRGVKPPRPELTDDEKKQRDAAAAKGERWHDRFDFYMFNDYTKDLNARSDKESETWKPFTWKTDYQPETTAVEFSETPDFSKPIVEQTGGKWDRGIRPKFLKLGTKYYWRVKGRDAAGNETVSDVRSFTTLDVPPRMIGIPGNNFRDLGGGTNVFGKGIRQGLLYRGPAPFCRATKEKLKDWYVDKLGIRLELDTREQDECEEYRTKWDEGNLDAFGIKHVYVAMEDYHLYHSRHRTDLPKIFEYLADKNNYPIYTHCTAGSDRTGTLCIMIDGVLGRSDRYIIDDYETPSFSRYHPRFRYGRKPSGVFAGLDAGNPRHAKEGPNLNCATMRENIEKYLLEIGVKKEHIDAFRKIMIED